MSKQTLGFSMTEGLMPEFIREDGKEGEIIPQMFQNYGKEYMKMLGENDYYFEQHIDFPIHKFSLVYDLGSKRGIERILISSYHYQFLDYTIGLFEFYASDKREDLFEEKNRILCYDNRFGTSIEKITNDSDLLFDVEGLTARFIAFRQLESNSVDVFSRIKNFCLYSEEYNFQKSFMFENNLAGSLISGLVPEISGDFEGEKEALTDSMVVSEESKLVIKSAELMLSSPAIKKANKLYIAGKGLENLIIDGKEIGISSSPLYKDIMLYETDEREFSEKLLIKIENAEIYSILAFAKDYEVLVDDKTIINEEFIGLGANVIPCHLFESSRMNGFYDQHMELEKRRIAAWNPQVIRMWFQIDWFVMDEKSYYERKYAFNSPKMLALYKELDAFLEAGTEIELNFGWKVGYAIQEWFSFPDVFNRKNSAPKDIDQYAIACADLLKELIIKRGYDNIKYLTFYNEANNSYTLPGGDFCVPEGINAKEYWKEMLIKTNIELKKAGLKDKIRIWAAETAGGINRFEPIEDWVDYFNKNAPEEYDFASYHIYRTSYDEAIKYAHIAKNLAGEHPICVTEFGEYTYGFKPGLDFDFERTNTSAVLGMMNGGVSAMLFWTMSGVYIDEHMLLDGPKTTIWRFPTDVRAELFPRKGGITGGTERYGELTLLTNYFPAHSKVIKTETSEKGMHASAIITPDGNYSIAVELDKIGRGERRLKIKLPSFINKKFRKHVYRLDDKIDGNMIVPPVSAEFSATDEIIDTIDSEYNLIVYTTLPPKKQVVMKELEIFMKPGETRKLEAFAIDSDEEITWSLPDCHYVIGFKGSITPDGVYTADPRHPYAITDANTKTDYVVKAELPSGEYAIAMIRVR